MANADGQAARKFGIVYPHGGDELRIRRRAADFAARGLSLALRAGGRPFYRYVLQSLWERQPFFEPSDDVPAKIELYYPGYVAPDPAERALVERIFAAYEKAKTDQRRADPVFLPSKAWQIVIDETFSSLVEGLRQKDQDRFHFFLANFRSWRTTTGMEPSQQLYEASRARAKAEHFEQRVVAPMLRWWQRSESHGRGLEALTMPRHGNQCGALVDGHLIAPSSIFCDAYGRLLAGFVSGSRPVLGELGGGFGRLFYFISRNLDPCCYVGLDLPESLCCAAYFLMKSFPEKRFLLYGEGDLTAESLERFDFVLFPSFDIERLPDRAIDLFINENSLGVMTPEACRLFVREICRCTDGFYHRNTESSRMDVGEGRKSLVNGEFPVPPEDFAQVARYADISRMMSSGRLNFDSDMYWYYYRRVAQPRTPDGDAPPPV